MIYLADCAVQNELENDCKQASIGNERTAPRHSVRPCHFGDVFDTHFLGGRALWPSNGQGCQIYRWKGLIPCYSKIYFWKRCGNSKSWRSPKEVLNPRLFFESDYEGFYEIYARIAGNQTFPVVYFEALYLSRPQSTATQETGATKEIVWRIARERSENAFTMLMQSGKWAM